MHKLHIIICGAVLLLFVGSIWYGSLSSKETRVSGSDTKTEAQEAPELATLLNEEGLVSVSITPLASSETSDEVQFNVALQTHSVELQYDMLSLVTLRDAKGNEYTPTAWDGDAPGGHHREGTLSFRVPASVQGDIILLVRGVGGIPERVFVW